MQQAAYRHPEVRVVRRASKDGRPERLGRTLRGPRNLSSGRPLRAGPVGGHLRVAVIAISFALLPAAAHSETIEEKAQVCAACHGENGVPPEQAFPVPVIWGQNLGYLFFQLRDFKSGARKNDVMSPLADALPREDLMALAQYFSKKPWPKLQQPHPPADVAALAQRANASVVCTSCHQDGFIGAGTQPRLAGQERAYLEKTMTEFQSGARGNNPGMTDLMKSLTPQDVSALAAWLAAM
jgi:cytochrome c553